MQGIRLQGNMPTYGKNNGILVTLIHENSELLEKWMMHNAHLVMSVSELPSGYCKEIDGQLEFFNGGLSLTDIDVPDLHFKASDSSVNFFVKGLSRYTV